MDVVGKIEKRVKMADYLAVAQIFLRDNFLLTRKLEFGDIKPRLLGHFGTCHGIDVAYAQLAAWREENKIEDFKFVLGVGHGFPALQANLFLDGELVKYDERATLDAAGVAYIAQQFSWPFGFPSHASPLTPDVILEGGELGYSLGTSFGAVLNAPKRIVACLIGDGEMETASLLASMNLNKLVSPVSNGIVLPILHLNGYKISGPTIYGRMSDKELKDLVKGFGYEPYFVNGEKTEDFMEVLRKIWEVYREVKLGQVSRLPFLVMKTEKGFGAPEIVNGEKVAGNYLSHQVPLPHAKTDEVELELLENWLRSYRFAVEDLR
jgi:xylulose-5-phosphate/fructose-6-phosphate phosphoketolase